MRYYDKPLKPQSKLFLHSGSRMEYEVQKVSGTFYLPMGDGFIQTYDNIQNVVVRLGSKANNQNDTHAILINCHFDSVPQVKRYTF